VSYTPSLCLVLYSKSICCTSIYTRPRGSIIYPPHYVNLSPYPPTNRTLAAHCLSLSGSGDVALLLRTEKTDNSDLIITRATQRPSILKKKKSKLRVLFICVLDAYPLLKFTVHATDLVAPRSWPTVCIIRKEKKFRARPRPFFKVQTAHRIKSKYPSCSCRCWQLANLY
jgi:hypothetical protein